MMLEGLQPCTLALIPAGGFLDLARFRTSAIAMAITVAIAMPTLDELGVDLFGTIKALAVIAIIGKWHELLEFLAEADTRRPFIKVEDVVDGPLRLDIDQLIVTTPSPMRAPVLICASSLRPWIVAETSSNLWSPG